MELDFNMTKELSLDHLLTEVMQYQSQQDTLVDPIYLGDDKAEYAIILLHGLGASGEDVQVIAQKVLDEFKCHGVSVRLILPTAPIQAVTMMGGLPMRSWFDIKALSAHELPDLDSINQAVETVRTLVDKELEMGVVEKNIFIAGFSQGGALALYASLWHELSIGGVIGLSTLVPKVMFEEKPKWRKNKPVMMMHGHQDQVISYELGKMTADEIQQGGADLTWHDYDIDHTIIDEQIPTLVNWVKRL